jgi:hypothetical protein
VLGCGLDDSYDQYFDRTFAVDLPAVIKQRLDRDRATHKPDNPPDKHYLIASDLCNPPLLLDKLESVGFDFTKPTIVLLECVLAYIQDANVEQLLSAIGATIRHCTVVIYDPLYDKVADNAIDDSADGASSTEDRKPSYMVADNFSRLLGASFRQVAASSKRINRTVMSTKQCPIMSNTCSSSSSRFGVSARLRGCGYPHVNVMNMQHAVDNTPLSPPPIDSSSFDEYASLCKLRQCYVLCVASNSEERFARVVGPSDPTSHHDRLRSLLARIATAEVRTASLSEYATASKRKNKCEGKHLLVREMQLVDRKLVCDLYAKVASFFRMVAFGIIRMTILLDIGI